MAKHNTLKNFFRSWLYFGKSRRWSCMENEGLISHS